MKRLLIVVMSLFILVGCSNTDDLNCSDGFHESEGICIEDANQVGTFTSGTEILGLVNAFKDRQETVQHFLGWRFMVGDMALEMDAEVAAPTSEEKGSDDYSETNNQVEGVDEMDNVLTDGKYIYVQNYNKIQIILAYTQSQEEDALSLVKEITFDELNPSEEHNQYFYFNGLYVDDDRLLVIGNSYEYSCSVPYEEKTDDEPKDGEEPNPDGDESYYYYDNCRYYEYHTSTLIFEYSTEDFELINEYELSGNFIGSRKIGDDVYFVTTEWIPFYMQDYEDYEFSLDTYLPEYQINGTEVSLGYEDVLYVEDTEPTNFTTFYGINLDTQEVSSEVVLGESGYNLYVSRNNIYLTGTKWNIDDALFMELDEAVDDGQDVELTENPYDISTSIVKVAIDEGKVEFANTGDVPGSALDQFAMDEDNGYIRMVTTEGNWWWWGGSNEINNRLLILDENLDIVSTIENIGKEGESVQSTRFVGDYAYIVTFLRTDPFYVFDLSDPLNPVMLSELEMPGFSDYLQPINEDFMLGIGYGDNDGGTQGLKISLYDVSDKTDAKIASEIIYDYEDNNYMWTSTVYNHKDLVVSVAKGIIVLPYNSHGYDEITGQWVYETGALVLNLDVETGLISERGRITHSEANSWDTYVYKAKYIENFLYTISSRYVIVSTLEDPSTELNRVEIGESRYVEYYGTTEPMED